MIIALFLGMILSTLDEIHQIYSVNRTPLLKDIIIDTVGALSGILIAVIITRILNKIILKRRNKNNDKF